MEEQSTEVKELGLRLRLIRTRQRRAVKDVAREAGLSRPGLSYIEGSYRLPRRSTLTKLCEVLGVSLEEVVKGTDVESKYLT